MMYGFANGFQVADDNWDRALNLNEGAPLSTHTNFRGPAIYPIIYGEVASNYFAGFTSGQAGYLGFRFNSQGTTLYGWAEVVIGTEDGGSFTVNQWAYEDTGANILVGATTAIPEPKAVATGLGLLALGAVGLRRWRQQKQAA